jgi:hypothetical protein
MKHETVAQIFPKIDGGQLIQNRGNVPLLDGFDYSDFVDGV